MKNSKEKIKQMHSMVEEDPEKEIIVEKRPKKSNFYEKIKTQSEKRSESIESKTASIKKKPKVTIFEFIFRTKEK